LIHDLNLPRQSLDIREVVAEASLALARLDADRLEELALACQTLNRDRGLNGGSGAMGGAEPGAVPSHSPGADRSPDRALARQAREAAGDMKAFGRVLDATRANLVVMRRLRQLRLGHIEYSEAQARGWSPSDPGYGNN
jgi:hypothetical protein